MQDKPILIPDRRPSNPFKDVREFLQTSAPQMMTPLGEKPNPEMVRLMWILIHEEVNTEFFTTWEAISEHGGTMEQMVQLCDDGLDSIWVIIWGLEAMGLPLEACWNELRRANMSKFPLVKDFPIPPLPLNIPEYRQDTCFIPYDVKELMGRWVLTNRATGKVMKPEGFTPPNMAEVVHKIITMKKLRTMPDVIADVFLKEYFLTTEAREENK